MAQDNKDVTQCAKASTLQLAVFYGALYTLAVGIGGTKPNISTIGANQFIDTKEKLHKLSFLNWWILGYALPTLGLLVSIMICVAGTRCLQKVHYYSGGLRLNSNLHQCGKVCLSLLGTWHGKNSKNWILEKSTMLQVLVSIYKL